MNFYKKKLLFFLLICLGKVFSQSQQKLPDLYNIVWHEQSQNSSESMPLVGGDIGCKFLPQFVFISKWLENLSHPVIYGISLILFPVLFIYMGFL